MKKIADILIGALLGAILGLILGVLFSDSLSEYLNDYRIFYFLDKEKPIVENIFPDITTDNKINEKPTVFEISVYDSGSGVDGNNSKIELWYKEKQRFKRIDCDLKKAKSDFTLKLPKKLKHGEYKLQLFLTDKANNYIEKSYPFVLKEKENIGIRISCKPYVKAKKTKIFSDFLEEYIAKFKNPPLDEFFEIDFVIGNNTKGAYLRDLNLSFGAGFVIYSFMESSKYRMKNYELINATLAYQRYMPEGAFFSSEQLLRIEQIAPHGLLHLIFLGSGSKSHPFFQSSVRIDGTYVFEGYGINEICTILKEVPINYSDNILDGSYRRRKQTAK